MEALWTRAKHRKTRPCFRVNGQVAWRRSKRVRSRDPLRSSSARIASHSARPFPNRRETSGGAAPPVPAGPAPAHERAIRLVFLRMTSAFSCSQLRPAPLAGSSAISKTIRPLARRASIAARRSSSPCPVNAETMTGLRPDESRRARCLRGRKRVVVQEIAFVPNLHEAAVIGGIDSKILREWLRRRAAAPRHLHARYRGHAK